MNPSKLRLATAVGAGIFVGVAATITHSVLAEKRSIAAEKEALPFKDIQAFVEILNRVKSDYVDPVDDQKLLENAVRGMLSGLDPHSSYLDKAEMEDMQTTTTGKFGGLGLEVQMQDGLVKVVSPIDDTPAAKAGIQAGDFVFKIDDVPVRGLSLSEAVDKMRGEPGTNVTLTVIRQGADKPLVLPLKREQIKVVSVRSKLLENGYGYLRVSTFAASTGKDVLAEMEKMQKQGDLKGLVLDLRNNPGGLLDAAVSVSDAFMEKGLVVYYQGRDTRTRRDYSARTGDVMKGKPIVVMINAGSASASEIVAGALQDSKRGVIVGTRSFGKGSVQTIMPLTNDTAIKITTARYYTPAGRSIQAEGIEPDVTFRPVKVSKAEDNFEGLREREADLKGRLDNPDPAQAKAQEAARAERAKQEEETQKLAESDYSLYEALNLLKGLAITAPR
jgi:carboxyl-terminal processing protease